MDKVSACYRIDVTGTDKFYIGSTSDYLQRTHTHRSRLKSSSNTNPNLQALHDAGYEMTFSILDTGTREEMFAMELELLKFHETDSNMLNVNISTVGGNFIDRNPNKEKILENKSKAVLGEMNPMHGKNHTVNARALIASAAKGNKRWVGRKHRKETRLKISEHAKTRVGELNAFFGKKHTEESKQKMADMRKGNKPTNSNVIMIDGVEYQSQARAAQALGVSIGTINFRLKSNTPQFAGYVVVKRGAA